MVDYPPPRFGVTAMETIVVSFIVASLTILFWKGLWHGIAAVYTALT